MEFIHDQASRSQLLVLKEAEAKSRFPDLVIAEGRSERRRLVGRLQHACCSTGHMCINTRTRIRDQERAPIAADSKRTMREKAKLDELTFALTGDVTEAHRQVPIHPDDWHYLGCQVVPGGNVFVNTVGTFGIASASYYWSRVAAAIGRLSQYLVARAATTWHMLVADDYLLECGGAASRSGLTLFFVLCASVGVPLSWHKTSGGDILVWVGFELLLRSRCVGISSRRAEWFARWTEKIANSTTVNIASFEEGLGRIMFVAGALEHERPFLCPLYRFISIHPRNATRKVPPYVTFIPRYLSAEIKKKRHYSCGTKLTTADCSPRVDAQASLQRTGIGGWFPAIDEKGKLNPWVSDWFSMEIRKEDFLWIFEKGDRPSLVISTLEAPAVLVALKLRFGETLESDDKRVLIATSITDNRGNGAALKQADVHALLLFSSTCGIGVVFEGEEDANDRGMGAPRVQQGSWSAGKRQYRRFRSKPSDARVGSVAFLEHFARSPEGRERG